MTSDLVKFFEPHRLCVKIQMSRFIYFCFLGGFKPACFGRSIMTALVFRFLRSCLRLSSKNFYHMAYRFYRLCKLFLIAFFELLRLLSFLFHVLLPTCYISL